MNKVHWFVTVTTIHDANLNNDDFIIVTRRLTHKLVCIHVRATDGKVYALDKESRAKFLDALEKVANGNAESEVGRNQSSKSPS